MGRKSEEKITAPIHDILRIVHDLKEATAIPHSLSQSPITIDFDSIDLPSPHPLLPPLLEAGFGHEFATTISKTYEINAEELKRRVQESIVVACRRIAELPVVTLASPPRLLVEKVVFTFTEIYLRRLEQWREEIIQRFKLTPKTLAKATPSDPPTFNHDYVPLFEHFFEENPFPTHADKVFLAKKSNMQYRQIHVWFQNRRNRTKKEGKALRKRPAHDGATKPLNRLYERMKGRVVESDLQVPIVSKLSSSQEATEIEIARDCVSKDTFASSSPPHAFPSSYPPVCHYDPFPCKSSSVHFSEPEWRRASCAKPPLPLSTNIDELVERFSQLNVRDERSKGSPELQSLAATAALTVIPSHAPHPSVVAPKYRQPTNIIQRYPLVRAPVSSSKVFPDYSHALKPATLVSFSVSPDKSELPGKRKTVPLPQRFPGRVRNAYRYNAPSESTSTSSASPRSFSPNSEGSSPAFSSVSSSPTPPDMGNTQELPYSFGSPSRSPFDSPIHLHNLGGMTAVIPSPVS